MAGYTVGIDLGTTRSAVAYVPGDEGDPEIIDNSQGRPVTPSAVYLTDDGEVVVGDPATDQAEMNPEQFADEVKRHMGEETEIALGDRTHHPEEISAMILRKLVGDAEDRLGEPVESAVVTVPAYFTDRQRSATASAAQIAGIEVERLLPEPSAAVLAYGLHEQKLGDARDETVFVYDLGGGTFDATLVEANYETSFIETIATDGDSELGGSDWTSRLADLAFDRIADDTGIDLRERSDMKEHRRRVRSSARDAKHRLSDQTRASLTVPMVAPEKGYNLDLTVSREEFEEATADLLAATEGPMDQVLADAGMGRDDVDKVLLVGGSTRMPQVESFVADYFDREPSKEISPDKAVAKGAAVQAAIASDRDVGAILPGSGSGGDGVVLFDVLPATLGLEVAGDRCVPVIERNTKIPTTVRSEQFSTQRPDQPSVCGDILQGESEIASENESLGELEIDEIPPRDPNDVSLAVEFTVSKDGTLTAEAEDLISGKQCTTTIRSVARHSDEEVHEMRDSLPPARDR